MTAQHDLDQLCRESWKALAHDLKATSNSMGRVGLSCARRHPALLLGGGALLGFGAVLFLTRGKKHKKHDLPMHADTRGDEAGSALRTEPSMEAQRREPAKPSKSARFASGAAVRILKSAARMWLVEHLSRQVYEDEPKEEPDADASELEVAAQSSA